MCPVARFVIGAFAEPGDERRQSIMNDRCWIGPARRPRGEEHDYGKGSARSRFNVVSPDPEL